MAMKQANAKQKQWMSDITQWVNDNGLHILYGDKYFEDVNMQRHHVLGRSAKQNKTPIGHWFIIPVPFELHDPNMNHVNHVGKCKKSFVEMFGTQRCIFRRMYNCMKQDGYSVPDSYIFHAIMDTRA